MLKVLVRVEIQYIYSKIIYKCIFSNTCSGLMMGLKVNVGFFFHSIESHVKDAR